jgi:hypothetical protein
MDELKVGMTEPMFNVPASTGEVVVERDDLVTFLH